jgi:hypothetical protein
MPLDELARLDDDQLGARIGVAFDTLPTPEPARLAAIRSHLPLDRPARMPRRRWPLWAVLLASGAAAAAAWYGATNLLRPTAPATPVPAASGESTNDAAHSRPARQPIPEKQIREQQESEGSPIIIQQERY